MARHALLTFGLLSLLQLAVGATYMQAIALRNESLAAAHLRVERRMQLDVQGTPTRASETAAEAATRRGAAAALRGEVQALEREAASFGHRDSLVLALRWLQIALVAAIGVAGAWWAARDHPEQPAPLA